MKVAIAATGTVLALSLGACSSSTPVADASASVSQASSAYCTQLATTEASVASLAALATNPNSTVDSIKEQRATVKSDLQKLSDDAKGLASTQKAANEALVTAYDTAIQSVPGDATVAQAGKQIEAATKALTVALAAVKQSANCS